MTKKILNLVMFAIMVFVNYLANALPLNEKTTAQLSEQYPNLFVPSGITFSIWGVIYLMLLIFVIIQFRETNKDIVQKVGWVFVISCAFNSLWIVAWHYEQLVLSVLIMLGLLVSLIIINYRFKSLSLSVSKAAFGTYLGWVCIATIANLTALLVSYNWGAWSFSQQTWTIIMISVGAIITAVTLYRLNNPFVGLAVLWAFLGIVTKQKDLNPSIVLVAIIAMGVVGSFTIFLFFRKDFLAKR